MLGISVVIPCYNAAKFIREAIQSVLDQQYDGPLEVLVGEDGSTDESREIADSFGTPVRVLCDPDGVNRGMSAVRNRCIAAASHPLVAFLDADDYWLPGHLTALADTMCERPELGLVYDDGHDVNTGGMVLYSRTPDLGRIGTRADDLLVEQRFPPAAVMVRRSVFDRVGMFDESLRNCADHDMWLRIVEVFPATHVPEYGFCYRIHSEQNSLSPRLWNAAHNVLAKAIQRYPYQRRTICKRRAVIAFRLSQIAARDHRFILAVAHLGKAVFLDPPRATGELWRRLRAPLATTRPGT